MNAKKIGILGAGKIGLALTTLWTRVGHTVLVGIRNPEKIQSDFQAQHITANVRSIQDTVIESSIIVLAVPHSALSDLIPKIKNHLDGKIVIDATNPFGLSPEGNVVSTLKSITEGTYIANLLPNSIIVRAFTHIMDELLISRGLRQPGLFAMAIAGNNNEAKFVVSELVNDTGFVPVDIGDLEDSMPLDPGGILFPQFFTVADMRATLKKYRKNVS